MNSEAWKEKFLAKQNERNAIKWFVSTLRGTQKNQVAVGDIDPNLVLTNRRATVNLIPGQIYFYRYDPKHKATLPYYDTAPLVVLLDIREDGLLCFNLHYIPPLLRQKIIDFMLDTITANKWDHKTKARINYGMIKSMSELAICKPAIKSYLFSHMRSKIVRIQAENWKMIAYLRIDRFVKATRQKVWAESRRLAKANRKGK